MLYVHFHDSYKEGYHVSCLIEDTKENGFKVMQHVGGMMELLQMDADDGILPWLSCLSWIFVISRVLYQF